jgi:hypothetical protein
MARTAKIAPTNAAAPAIHQKYLMISPTTSKTTNTTAKPAPPSG